MINSTTDTIEAILLTIAMLAVGAILTMSLI